METLRLLFYYIIFDLSPPVMNSICFSTVPDYGSIHLQSFSIFIIFFLLIFQNQSYPLGDKVLSILLIK